MIYTIRYDLYDTLSGVGPFDVDQVSEVIDDEHATFEAGNGLRNVFTQRSTWVDGCFTTHLRFVLAGFRDGTTACASFEAAEGINRAQAHGACAPFMPEMSPVSGP